MSYYTLYTDSCKECNITDKANKTFIPFSLFYLSAKQVIENNKPSEYNIIKSTILEYQLENFQFRYRKLPYRIAYPLCTHTVQIPFASGKELIHLEYPKVKILRNYCECRFPVCYHCVGYSIIYKVNSHLKNCVNEYK